MTITIGGKPITAFDGTKPQQPRLGKHRLLTSEQIVKRHPAEPFPPISAFRNDSVESRLSIACDLKTWVGAKLDEMVPLADESEWLRLQLREPSLEGHSMRQDALDRLRGMNDSLAELGSDVAFLEAHADRIWQSLDPTDRTEMARHWVAKESEDRVILNAWTRIAQVGFKWPDNYMVKRRWFDCLAPPLIFDMEERGLKEGIRLGRIVDPFESEEEHGTTEEQL